MKRQPEAKEKDLRRFIAREIQAIDAAGGPAAGTDNALRYRAALAKLDRLNSEKKPVYEAEKLISIQKDLKEVRNGMGAPAAIASSQSAAPSRASAAIAPGQLAAPAGRRPRVSWARPASENFGNEFKATLVGYGAVLNKTSGPAGVFPVNWNEQSIRLTEDAKTGNRVTIQTVTLKGGGELVATATGNEEGKYANNVEVNLTNTRNEKGITALDMAQAADILSTIMSRATERKDPVKLQLAENNSEQANAVVKGNISPQVIMSTAPTIASADISFQAAEHTETNIATAIAEVRRSDNTLALEKSSANEFKVVSKDGNFSITVDISDFSQKNASNSKEDRSARIKIDAEPGHEEKALEAAVKIMEKIDDRTMAVNKVSVSDEGSHKESFDSKVESKGLKVNNANLEY